MLLSSAGRKRPVASGLTRRLPSQRCSKGRRREGARSPPTTRLPRQGCKDAWKPPAWVSLPRPIPQVGTSPRPGRHGPWGTESHTETQTGKIETCAKGSACAACPASRLQGLVPNAAAARSKARSSTSLGASPLSPTDLIRRGPQFSAPGAHPAAQQQPQDQKRRD